ncbi:IDEAL domain-containing protein [Halobacillus shinanisalinarum]|uniref:IDEAL domain-containing protein n=1 Tax=Halobacillus shinanisalinarum TaxID=2932258 RepID=A0ABY4H4D9_9BACI|nr:IDEAL domain-containing protein [Halobacillus shinanisalinarum]UOQ94442.1 IDEAL domain-containing protein [Halobacillus shinanisalinarum]
MLNVKMLKPYYVKEDKRFIRIVLAYQYFSLFIDEELYQFIPKESREIIIDRKRKRVHNVFDIFVFQRGKRIVYVSVADLLELPDFLTHLHSITSPYYQEDVEDIIEENHDISVIIEELEKSNLQRLIDQSLDIRDQEAFTSLTETLHSEYS